MTGWLIFWRGQCWDENIPAPWFAYGCNLARVNLVPEHTISQLQPRGNSGVYLRLKTTTGPPGIPGWSRAWMSIGSPPNVGHLRSWLPMLFHMNGGMTWHDLLINAVPPILRYFKGWFEAEENLFWSVQVDYHIHLNSNIYCKYSK